MTTQFVSFVNNASRMRVERSFSSMPLFFLGKWFSGHKGKLKLPLSDSTLQIAGLFLFAVTLSSQRRGVTLPQSGKSAGDLSPGGEGGGGGSTRNLARYPALDIWITSTG